MALGLEDRLVVATNAIELQAKPLQFEFCGSDRRDGHPNPAMSPKGLSVSSVASSDSLGLKIGKLIDSMSFWEAYPSRLYLEGFGKEEIGQKWQHLLGTRFRLGDL